LARKTLSQGVDTIDSRVVTEHPNAFKVLQITVKAYKRLYMRVDLDLLGRAKPSTWAGYQLASLAMKIITRGTSKRLQDLLLVNNIV